MIFCFNGMALCYTENCLPVDLKSIVTYANGHFVMKSERCKIVYATDRVSY